MMPNNHVVRDDDLMFTIDPTTRVIKNESGVTRLMQYDHNSEIFTFEAPQFIEGHDMSLCTSIQIHYKNIGSGTSASVRGVNYGIYEATPHVTDDGKIVFKWPVSQNATIYAGTLKFQIKFRCMHLEESGNYYDDYIWNTDVYSSIEIAAGIDNSGAIYEEYEDLLNQWKEEIDAELASKAELDSVSESANALKETLNGEIIGISDISPIPHTVKVKVKSKNLIPYPYYDTRTDFNGLTITYNDNGQIHFEGKTTARVVYVLMATTDGAKRIPLKAGTYTLSGNPSSYSMSAFFYADNTTSSHMKNIIVNNGQKVTYTLTKDGYVGCYIVIPAGETAVDFTLSPQLEFGVEATEYVAYLAPTTATLTVYGADETDNLQTFDPSEDWSYEIESIAPTMTLMTDKSGVIIEAEYNRDVNIAMAELKGDMGDIDVALDGIIAIQNTLLGVNE